LLEVNDSEGARVKLIMKRLGVDPPTGPSDSRRD
jgi:hypothetical protein